MRPHHAFIRGTPFVARGGRCTPPRRSFSHLLAIPITPRPDGPAPRGTVFAAEPPGRPQVPLGEQRCPPGPSGTPPTSPSLRIAPPLQALPPPRSWGPTTGRKPRATSPFQSPPPRS